MWVRGKLTNKKSGFMVGFLGFNGILPMKNEIRLQQMMG
jgi:hypothetical protein